MPTTNRQKAKGRRQSGSFTALPHSIFRSTPHKNAPTAVLSKTALALLVDICQQLNGSNNGNLSAAPKILQAYGWRSRGTVDDSLVELVALGFLVQTRQGGRNPCSLYAVTWRGIDEGPHEAKADPVPSHLWKPENYTRRDERFMQRWLQRGKRRRQIGNASRYSDKASRYTDKSGVATQAR
jgi:hypothetical protein